MARRCAATWVGTASGGRAREMICYIMSNSKPNGSIPSGFCRIGEGGDSRRATCDRGIVRSHRTPASAATPRSRVDRCAVRWRSTACRRRCPVADLLARAERQRRARVDRRHAARSAGVARLRGGRAGARPYPARPARQQRRRIGEAEGRAVDERIVPTACIDALNMRTAPRDAWRRAAPERSSSRHGAKNTSVRFVRLPALVWTKNGWNDDDGRTSSPW